MSESFVQFEDETERSFPTRKAAMKWLNNFANQFVRPENFRSAWLDDLEELSNYEASILSNFSKETKNLAVTVVSGETAIVNGFARPSKPRYLGIGFCYQAEK